MSQALGDLTTAAALRDDEVLAMLVGQTGFSTPELRKRLESVAGQTKVRRALGDALPQTREALAPFTVKAARLLGLAPEIARVWDLPEERVELKSLDFEVEQDRHLLGWRTGDNPCELINAYVDPRARGEGLGRLLVHGLIALAREHSYDEILVSSGRRYRETGWTFYDKVFGERRGVHPERYGKGRDAPVWGMKLPRA